MNETVTLPAAGKLLGKGHQHPAMSTALHIAPNRDATEHRISADDIDPDHTDRLIPMQQQLGKMSLRALVWMTLIVNPKLAPRLEQHAAANVVVAGPVTCLHGRHQNVIRRVHVPVHWFMFLDSIPTGAAWLVSPGLAPPAPL